MASFQKRFRKDGRHYYTATVRAGGGPSRSASFETMRDAREWAGQVEAAIRESRYFPTRALRRRTFRDAAERYRLEHLPTLRDQRNAARILDWWEGKLGSVRLVDITAERLAEHLQDKAKRAPATSNRYKSHVRRVLNLCVRWGWLPVNPAARLPDRREPVGRLRYLDRAELEALLTACDKHGGDKLRGLVLLAVATGGRRGELLRLKWSQVDVERGQVRFLATKNATPRGVPVRGRALDWLRAQPDRRGFVFPSPFDPARAWEPRESFALAVAEAGLENFRFHDLRHTCASWLAMSGASLLEISETLGHKSLAMVRRYSHLTEGHTASALERMTAKLETAEKKPEAEPEATAEGNAGEESGMQ